MALSRITEAVASFTDLTIADDLTLSDDLLMASDAAKISFGADADVSFTHVADTGLLLNSTSVIQFNDASQNIGAPSATVLDINATDEIELNATLIDVNGNLDVSGTIVSGGTLTATTSIGIGSAVLTEAELEFLDGITAGTAAASKALILDGSTNISGIGTIGSGNITSSGTISGTVITSSNAFVPNGANGASLGTAALEFSDLFLHDGAVINLGTDQDVTITHVADTGVLVNGASVIQFRDSAINIGSPADGDLDINADDEIELNSTLIDVNGNLDVSGTIVGASTISGTTITAATAFVPDANDGATVGTAALAFSDIFLADGATIQLGNDEEITITHVHNSGITLTNTVNGTDDSPIVLQLKSEEDAIVDGDVIASIEFAAGDSDGTDGATVAAGIHAIAESTFTSSANETKLIFTTGASETAAASATPKMILNSSGSVAITGDFRIKDGGKIGVVSDPDAIVIGADGVVTMNQIPVLSAGLNVSGGTIAGTLATAAQGNITSLGNLSALTVDDITIDGSTITDAGSMTMTVGALTIDATNDIILDAGGQNIVFKDDGTEFGQIYQSSNNLHLYSAISDADIKIQGNDGGATVTALALDMSNAGRATFSENIVLSAAGAGVYLGVTSSTAANLLDDYEEGTWSARLNGSTSNPSTDVEVSGNYTKIGQLVHASFQFANVNTTGAAGAPRIFNLPFSASPGGVAAGSVMVYSRFAMSANASTVTAQATGTQIHIYQSTGGAAWGEIAHAAGTGAYLFGSVTYRTA